MGSKYTPSGALIRDPDHPGTQSIRSSVLFLDSLDTFSRISGLFQDHLENFQIIQTHNSRSSILFLEYPDTCFRLSGHFLHHLETFLFIPTLFLIIRKLSTSSGHFVCYLDILCSIWTFSKIFGNSSANNDLVSKAFRSALLRR